MTFILSKLVILITVAALSRETGGCFSVPDCQVEAEVRACVADPQRADSLARAVESYLATDEDTYIRYADAMLAAGYEASPRIEWLRDMALRARPGTEAPDFEFELPDGSTTRLSARLGGGPVVLMFYDPDCQGCRDTIDELAAIEGVGVVAIDTGTDPAACHALPEGWTQGRDPDADRADEVYVIPAQPTLYLIGPDGRIILRDTTPAAIADALSRGQ